MADYKLSTDYVLDATKAFKTLDSLESRMKRMSKDFVLGAGGAGTGGKIPRLPSVPAMGAGDSFGALLKGAAALGAAFIGLHTAVRVASFSLSAMEEFRKDQLDLNSRLRMQFRPELASGEVSLPQISGTVNILQKRLLEMANSIGANVHDVTHDFGLMSSVLREFTGASVNDALKFVESFTKAKPFLAAITTNPQTIAQELVKLIGTGTVDMGTPLAMDIMATMGADPRLKGQGTRSLGKMSAQERMGFVNDFLSHISEATTSPVNTMEGQKNISYNLIRQIFGENSQIYDQVVQGLKRFNSFLASPEFESSIKSLLNVFVSAASVISSVSSSISSIFGTSVMGGISEVLNSLSRDLLLTSGGIKSFMATLFTVVAGIAKVASWIPHAEFRPEGLLGGFVAEKSALKEEEKSIGLLEYSTQQANLFANEAQEIFKKAMISEERTPESPDSVGGILDKRGHAVTQQNIVQNIHNVINMTQNLPPDLVAQTVSAAIRESMMIPRASARAKNPFAFAR